MKILFLAPKIPWPATDGSRIALYELIRHMTARGHQAAFLGFGNPGAADEFRTRAGVTWAKAIPHDTSTNYLNAALAVLSPMPYTPSKYRSGAMTAAVREAFREQRFDLVHLEGTHMAHYLGLVQGLGVQAILRLQNVEWILEERYARTAVFPLNVYVRVQAGRMRAFETRACRQADLCVAITQEDAERILAIAPDASVAVSPAGVDLERYYPQPMSEEPGTIVFVGALDWPPNADAIRWFRTKVWPRIAQEEPTARWIVVGKSPPADILHWPEEDRNIEVTGFVDDVRPHLHRASVVIVPLRSGGGMRLKILEAMAAGKTVVSTPMGAEGISAGNGEEIILADADRSYGVEVVRLLRQPSERKRIGKAARAWAEGYGWDGIAADLEREYQALLGSRLR
ncbi:MAG: glycosyltransferase [Anaerolineales bacterium]|nr:glycosyltransferase [Anaerolineales bacterium]